MKSKGLSSVVGAVLLIVISVGAAASAWTFIDSITGQAQDNIEDRVSERQEDANSELNSEVAYNSSDGYIIVTLRNSGSNTLPLQSEEGEKTLDLFVDGRPVNDDSSSWKFLEDKNGMVTIDPTESMPVNTTSTFPSNGETKTLEFNGPYSTSTTYVCYNSGTASC